MSRGSKDVMRNIVLLGVFLSAFITSVNGELDELPQKVIDFIDNQERVVRAIAENMARLHSDRRRFVRECECALHACGAISPKSTCFSHLDTPDICKGHEKGQLMDNTTSMFRTPPGVTPSSLTPSLKESICVYQHLDETFQTFGTEELGWIYVGTRDGHHRRYPASAGARDEEYEDEPFNGCNPFDPRLRPWYIAASTGPKDIVLIVDKSGSMHDVIGTGSKTKWDVTKQAVSDILDTFGIADFVNVVTFSDGAEPLWRETGLVRGTAENLEELREALDTVEPKGQTNFTAAFTTAFRLLWENCDDEPKSCSNCQKVILFLTDGSDNSGPNRESIKPSQMAILINRLQERLLDETGSRAVIFSYSMTDKADDSIPRQIACANDGAWSFIGPNTNTLDALNSYSLYLADGRRSSSPIWIEPYEDFSGAGLVTTVALPVYANGSEGLPGAFLGVAGHDVSLNELDIEGLNEEAILNEIIDRSERCTRSMNSACDLQAFRDVHSTHSLCPDPYPTTAVSAGRESLHGASVLCYERLDYFYKRFSDEIPWRKAVERCEQDGGELVTVRDAAELAFIANLASADGSWIGAQNTSPERFAWLDASVDDLSDRSSYWGVGEPSTEEATEYCVAVDNRGVIANLMTKPCRELISFMCKYQNDTSCPENRVFPERGFFRVPPIETCTEPETLVETKPVPEAAALDPAEIICDLDVQPAREDSVCCIGPLEVTNSYEQVLSEATTLPLAFGFAVLLLLL